MATLAFYFLAFTLLCNLSSFPLLANAISSCGGSCTTLDDCAGQLICINGKCNDDPDAGTQICGVASGGGGGDDGSCRPFGTLTCSDGKSSDRYRCSPTITSSTQATLTLNQFYEGGDGGGPSKCDGNYHDDSEPVVALSTGWFNAEPWCEKMITITTSDGKSTTAKVVDECDSVNGCDREHAGQPPCKNNIVDGSKAVWDALGLNSDVGEEQVTWSMA